MTDGTTVSSSKCCPSCGSPESTVTDSRQHELGVRRRRRCLCCAARWSTVEVHIGIVDDIPHLIARLAEIGLQIAEVKTGFSKVIDDD